MKTILKDLATIQMGYSFRSRLEATGNGDVAVVQMKDLMSDNTVDCGSLARVEMKSVKDHHLIEKGDLVFRSRGLVATAAVLNDDPGKAVVAAPLLRIRIKDTSVLLPEYLNWYISQWEAQKFFDSRAKGTVQKMISKNSLEHLEVPVPSLEAQKTIVELAALSARERSILGELAVRREQVISRKLIQFAEEE